jgi:hypothetical protein
MWEESPSLAEQLFDQLPVATVLQLAAEAAAGATSADPPQSAAATAPISNRLMLGIPLFPLAD